MPLLYNCRNLGSVTLQSYESQSDYQLALAQLIYCGEHPHHAYTALRRYRRRLRLHYIQRQRRRYLTLLRSYN